MSDDRPRLLSGVTVAHGPQVVRVGSTEYTIPTSAGVVRAQGGDLAYVLSEGRIHCLGARGEIFIPARLRHVLVSAYFGAGRPKTT
jgi:hypothetical protein